MNPSQSDAIAKAFFLYYSYAYDKEGRDVWHILKRKKGRFLGDCEDCALTLLYMLSDESLLRFWYNLLFTDTRLLYCEFQGVGHAVLQYEGRYIDNVQREFVSFDTLLNKGYRFDLTLFRWYHVAIKLLRGKFNRP